jgi:hypothetical protein
MSGHSELQARLREELEDPDLPLLVETYFRRDEPVFAGELFNTLGTNEPYSVEADDLLAVGLLDEAFDAEAAYRILMEDRETYAQLLHDIGPDVDIWDPKANVDDGSPADQMWDRLEAINGVGPVRAGKLLARKRPHLIPIWDSVMARIFPGQGKEYWTRMRDCLAEDDFHEKVAQTLRPEWLSPLVPTLRLLDGALWMKHSTGEAATRSRARIAGERSDRERS